MDTTRPDPSVMTVGDYAHIGRTYWFTILGGALAGLVIGVLLTFVITPTYVSSAEVLVSALSTDTGPVANGRSVGAVNLDTEVQIASSLEVADVANEDIAGSDDPRELLKHLSVTVPANTAVLVFSFSASTPEEAQAGADAFANAYLGNRKAVEDDTVAAQVKFIKGRIAELEAERSPDQAQITSLRAELARLGSVPAAPGRIIAPAELPEAPDSPKRSLYGLVGLALGLLAGSTVAFWRWRNSDILKSRRDIERTVGMPVAAAVPQPSEIVRSRSEHDRWSRGVRTVSLGLAGAAGAVPHRLVSILGVGTEADAPLAQDLQRTLEARGLSCAEYAMVDSTPSAVGPASEESRATAARTGRAELLALRARHDIVLITTANLPTALDLLEIAQLGDATVLLVESGRSTATALAQVSAGLEQLHIPVIAVVVVDPSSGTPVRT